MQPETKLKQQEFFRRQVYHLNRLALIKMEYAVDVERKEMISHCLVLECSFKKTSQKRGLCSF